jgi:heptosyltransferase-2
MAQQKRILVVRQDRIGDVVLSTHIPRAMKSQWPECFVAVLVSTYTKDIYINNPYVDKIIIIDDIPLTGIKNFLKKVNEIRSCGFTHSLMLLPSKRINYMLFCSGIRYRLGVGQKFYQFITFVKGVSRHKYNPLRHEADYCMDLARTIGINSNDINPQIFLTEAERYQIAALRIKARKENKYLLGINSTSGNSSPNLRPEIYFQLIKRLQKQTKFQLVVTDNKVPELLQRIDGVEYPNIGARLRNSFITFASLDCLISSSTGPMHIAAALGVNTISVFCPTSACSPQLWGPVGNTGKIILPDNNYCGVKCPGNPKVCTLEGEGGINIGKILYALNEMFTSTKIHEKIPVKSYSA